MSLESLETTLAKWKREVAETPDATVLKQKDIDQLLKKIDRIYAMESKVQRYIDKVQVFVKKDRGF
jgi:hypothetical protein